MQQTIINGVTMDVNKDLKFGYSKPKPNNFGGKAVYTTKKVYITTPEMITWGAEDFKEPGEETGNGRFKLSMQFLKPEEEDVEPGTSENARFLKNMIELENKIKDDIVLNSKEWWGKEKSRSLIDEQFKSILIYPKTNNIPDDTRPPSFGLKMQKKFGTEKFNFELYDEDENRLYPPNSEDEEDVDPLKYIVRLSKVQAMFTYNGLLLAGGNIHPLLTLSQIQISKNVATVEGKCHLKMKKNTAAPAVSTYVNDSEDEETTVGRKRSFSVVADDADTAAAAAADPEPEPDSSVLGSTEDDSLQVKDEEPTVIKSEPLKRKRIAVPKKKEEEKGTN